MGRRVPRMFVPSIVVAALLVSVAPAVGAQDTDGVDEPGTTTVTPAERELAERHAPVIMLKAQDDECDPDGEPYRPESVEIVLDNPEVALRQLGQQNPVVKWGPTAEDLHGVGRGFFLDFPGNALEPGCLYERDNERFAADQSATVYAHVVTDPDHPDRLALQYWIYWYYNDWNNKHESDWEGIQLLFEATSAEEALALEPLRVGYAQHEGGERADWDDDKLQREGERPVVYSSAGSHASYFSSAVYMGRSGSEGFGCDNTDGPSTRIDPDVVVLPDHVDDPDDPLAWLAYDGRWGERQSGPFNGPTGPAAKGRWSEPVAWDEELRSSSVVLPGGDGQGAVVAAAFCDVVEWGSGTLIRFTLSPARTIIGLLLVAFVARAAIRRTQWQAVTTVPLHRRRRAGQIIRAAAGVYRHAPWALLAFGLIYLPTSLLAGLVGRVVASLPVFDNVIELAGTNSGTNLVFALAAGGVPSLVAYVAVNAMVAHYFEPREVGDDISVLDPMRELWHHKGALFGGLVRATVIVYGLMITIIGIPWAIRQLVRYQFMPQAVTLEELDGTEALARSTELVKGRWFHTFVMVLLFNGLAGAASLGLGLVILVLSGGLPLWLFSALVTTVYVVIVPLTAVAQTLLYGDAVAEHEGLAEAEPLVVEPALSR